MSVDFVGRIPWLKEERERCEIAAEATQLPDVEIRIVVSMKRLLALIAIAEAAELIGWWGDAGIEGRIQKAVEAAGTVP